MPTSSATRIAEMADLTPALHPYIISATGSGDSICYAACFREMTVAPEWDPIMTGDQYTEKCKAQRSANRKLIWVDAFGTASDILYCAVWGDNPDNVGWNVEALNDKGAFAETRHDVLRSIGARPVHVALTPDGGRAKLYVDTQAVHSWFSAGLMNADRVQEVCDEQAAHQRHPISIGTAVLDNALHFSAIFAKSDSVIPRTFRANGQNPAWNSDADEARGADIDEWVHRHLRLHGRHGAALAIVQGTRLVYAKGYTYAEPGVRDITPRTLFRLASVSKALCAAAVWKALFESPESRRSTLQSILQLKTSDGREPGGNFDRITLRHLLECRSGIPQESMRDAMGRIRDGEERGNQPASVATLAREVASVGTTMTDAQVADGAATKYGKTDYWLLGQVAAKLCGTDDFDAALKRLLLDPLQMRLTTSSGSRFDPTATHVPVYHRPDIATGKSAIDDNRRLVPRQYGWENYGVFDGAGGVSSAVVDVARLCAMYSCQAGNPIFSARQLDEMFDDAIAAATRAAAEEQALKAANPDAEFHGCYHGFGVARRNGAGVELAKGGDLTAVETDFRGFTGPSIATRPTKDLFIVFLRNGDKRPAAGGPNWNSDTDGVRAIAEQITWTADLFPAFEMDPL